MTGEIKEKEIIIEMMMIITENCSEKEEIEEIFSRIYKVMNEMEYNEETNNIMIGTYITTLIKIILKGKRILEKGKRNEITAKGIQIMLKIMKGVKNEEIKTRIRQGITAITSEKEEIMKIYFEEEKGEEKEEEIKRRTKTKEVEEEIIF